MIENIHLSKLDSLPVFYKIKTIKIYNPNLLFILLSINLLNSFLLNSNVTCIIQITCVLQSYLSLTRNSTYVFKKILNDSLVLKTLFLDMAYKYENHPNKYTITTVFLTFILPHSSLWIDHIFSQFVSFELIWINATYIFSYKNTLYNRFVVFGKIVFKSFITNPCLVLFFSDRDQYKDMNFKYYYAYNPFWVLIFVPSKFILFDENLFPIRNEAY